MAQILVIGASRGIGLEVVRQGLERGHRIRAFARGADAIEVDDPALEKVAGDATDPRAVAQALDGVDAVVLALGVPKDYKFIVKPVTLFSEATETLLPVMEEHGVRRLVAVTGFGAGRSRAALSGLEKVPFKLVMGRAYDDKSRQEEMIEGSGLDWTIVRPGILTANRKTGDYKVLVSPDEWRNGVIPRADVADFILTALEGGSHVRGDPVLVR